MIDQGGVPGLSDPNQINVPDYYSPQGSNSSGAEVGTQLPNNETPEAIARGQQTDPNNTNLQLGPLDPSLPTDQERLLAAGNTYVALFEKFKKQLHRDLEMTGLTRVEVPYPPAACSQKLEGTAVFGVVVNPQGAIVAFPPDAKIASTGSAILDNAARTAIISPSLTFEAASTHKLYQLVVEFNYDEKVCSRIPVTPSTAPTKPNPAGQQPPAVAPTRPGPTGQPPSPAPTEVKPQFEKPPAAGTKPQPGAQPSQPAPKPAAPPSPSPQPKPAAEQSPEPRPQPAEVSPQPEAAPSPAPEVSPEPEAAPSPAAEVSPQPEAAPSPAAEESPQPEAAPSPAAEVSPSPVPSPSPSPAATTEN
jgi:hypothetical protein